jgi:hypothetical protein
LTANSAALVEFWPSKPSGPVSGPTKGIKIEAGIAATGSAGASVAAAGSTGAAVAATGSTGASVGAGVAAGAQLASSIDAIIKKLKTNMIFEVTFNIFYLSFLFGFFGKNFRYKLCLTLILSAYGITSFF